MSTPTSLPSEPQPPAVFSGGDAHAAFVAELTAQVVSRHIFALMLRCVAAVALDAPGDMSFETGLRRSDLLALSRTFALPPAFERAAAAASAAVDVDEEEEQVRALLARYARDDRFETRCAIAIVARRAMQANHLWQDLGLPSRAELNQLLAHFFPELHARNVSNMKWKKFFYRCLCELEGFVLCTAPSCSVCADFDNCFGPEDGASLLAHTRRATEIMSQT